MNIVSKFRDSGRHCSILECRMDMLAHGGGIENEGVQVKGRLHVLTSSQLITF